MQTYKSMLKVSAVLLKLQLSVEVEAKEPQDGGADADSFRRRWYTDHLRNLLTDPKIRAHFQGSCLPQHPAYTSGPG